MFSGEIVIHVKGADRTLKFGTLSSALFCEAEGIKLKEMGHRISNPEPYSQINLIHTAAVAFCRINKKDVDFSLDDVTEWIDEVGEDRLAAMILEAMKVDFEKKSKNFLALQKVGLTTE